MKDVRLDGISWLSFIDGSGEWYCGRSFGSGDLYEAQELAESGRMPSGDELKLVHWPDGAVYTPFERREGVCFGNVVCCDHRIYILSVCFVERKIRIHTFDCGTKEVCAAAEILLDAVEDCYNLRLIAAPATLCRSGKDSRVDILWPEQSSFRTDSHESLFLRESGRLYLSCWYEDPDYREDIIARDLHDGRIIEQILGDIRIMPDGALWHIY